MNHLKSERQLEQRQSIGLLRFAWLAVLLLPPGLRAQSSFSLSLLARRGDPAPVPPELGQASSPSLNDSGQVAFMGDGAVFLRSSGSTILVAAAGDPAPEGGTFVEVGRPSLNAQGNVAFDARAVGPPDRIGIFRFDGSTVAKLVASGDPAPGGGTFLGAGAPSLNAAGQVVFGAAATTGAGLFLWSQGTVSPVALQGQPVPGGGTIAYTTGSRINSSGQIVFVAALNPGGEAIFLSTGGTLTAVARTGDPLPEGGTLDLSSIRLAQDRLPPAADPGAWIDAAQQSVAGASLSYFLGTSVAAINDAGQVAFAARASIAGRGGIFLFSNGQITRAVRELDPAPGGGIFTSPESPSLNASGQIAFRSYVPPGNPGVFLLSGGKYTQIARPPQPGPEGDAFSTALDPSLNSTGQVAFTGEFVARLPGVYLFSEGVIDRVAGQGDGVEREPRFRFAYARAIDAAGRALFNATAFPGGSGLFDGSPTPVVRVGQPALDGSVFTLVSELAVNASGHAALAAATTRGVGMYALSDGQITRIASSGDPAPGGGSFFSLESPSINEDGDIAFVAAVAPSYRFGLYVFSGGELRSLLTAGGPAPGGGTFENFGNLSFHDAGHLAFLASLTPAGNAGVFLWSEGNLQAIARTGDPAPGGGTFAFYSYADRTSAPSLNASGQLAFGAPLSTGRSGIFMFSGGSVSTLVRPGDPAPGGGTFDFADSASLNDGGQVAFDSSISQASFGVYLYSAGSISAVAVAGTPAPGGGSMLICFDPKLNAQTQVAFTGHVDSSDGAFLATPVR